MDDCCAACAKRSNCAAWTFKPKSISKKNKGCYLRKAGEKSLITRKGYWSGYVGELPPSPPPPPPPSPPPPSPPPPYEEAVYQDPYAEIVYEDPYADDIYPISSPPPPPPPDVYQPLEGEPPRLPGGTAKYKNVLKDAWKFYEAQRSGEVPSWNRIDWRGESHMTDRVLGGWYDAGDTLKLNFPLQASIGHIAHGLVDFDTGYKRSEQKVWALRNFKIAVRYLFECYDKEAGTYIGQIGDPKIDHSSWGRPEDKTDKRPAYIYKKDMAAADLFGGVAGALAAASIVFERENEPVFAAELLDAAKDLYSWGDGNPGRYSNYYKDQTKIYKSGDSDDSMAWAAGWLYRATKDDTWLTKAFTFWNYKEADVYPCWDSLWAGHAVHMVSLADRGINIPGESEYRRYLDDKFYRAWLKADGFQSIVKTPQGMVYPKWNKWANLQFSTTVAYMAIMTAKFTKNEQQRSTLLDFAQGQVDYAMGANKHRSYVIGYGFNYPRYAHHAAASCPDIPAPCGKEQFRSPAPNPQTLYGAMVAGPAGERADAENPDDTYNDERDDYVTNEVAIDYNAGLVNALVGLYEQR